MAGPISTVRSFRAVRTTGNSGPPNSIWLLGETLRAGLPEYAHRLRMRDEQGRGLIDHGGICLLELGKFAARPSASVPRRRPRSSARRRPWPKSSGCGACWETTQMHSKVLAVEPWQAPVRAAPAVICGSGAR